MIQARRVLKVKVESSSSGGHLVRAQDSPPAQVALGMLGGMLQEEEEAGGGQEREELRTQGHKQDSNSGRKQTEESDGAGEVREATGSEGGIPREHLKSFLFQRLFLRSSTANKSLDSNITRDQLLNEGSEKHKVDQNTNAMPLQARPALNLGLGARSEQSTQVGSLFTSPTLRLGKAWLSSQAVSSWSTSEQSPTGTHTASSPDFVRLNCTTESSLRGQHCGRCRGASAEVTAEAIHRIPLQYLKLGIRRVY